MDLNPDVLIIGGGPAGTTAGAFLARKGHRVCLLEKSRHPKFHVGESLLPMNMPLFESLGVAEEVAEIGLPKIGADFTYGADSSEYRTYRFDRALGESPPSAYEVKREEFDHVLFRNCQRAGVETFEDTKVCSLDLNGGEPIVVSKGPDGEETTWRPRFVIDASGRDAFAASQLGWKKKNPKHASAAIFGHFKNVERRPGADEGNISIYWHKNGWMWMIPLREEGVMSVGTACWPDYLKTRKTDTRQFLLDTIASCPAAAERMEGAESISPVRVAANYSYNSSKCWDDGFMAIGDAYTFIDPVFSSGVYLAMNGAERAVAPVEQWLSGDRAGYRSSCQRYEKTTKKGLKRFSWFIYRFTSPAMRNLFNNPKNVLRVEDAVISMLAGDVFSNPGVQRRLLLFRVIYGVSWLLTLKDSILARRRRLAAARVPNDTVMEVS